MESHYHCLWRSPHTRAISKRILRQCDRLKLEGMLTWGAIVWSSLSDLVTTYESSRESMAYFIHQRRLLICPLQHYSEQAFFEKGATLWAIWKSRCRKSLKQKWYRRWKSSRTSGLKSSTTKDSNMMACQETHTQQQLRS